MAAQIENVKLVGSEVVHRSRALCYLHLQTKELGRYKQRERERGRKGERQTDRKLEKETKRKKGR